MNIFFVIFCVWQLAIGLWLILYGQNKKNNFVEHLGIFLFPIAFLVFYVVEKLFLRNKK